MNGMRFGGCLAALLVISHAGAVDAQAQSADLAITKTLTDPAIPPALGIAPGTNIVYTIVVTNNGPSSASNVSVEDDTPAGLTFVSNAGNCTGAFPCALGTLTNGQTKTIVATYSIPANYAPPTAVANFADVFSTTPDPNSDNNTGYVIAPVNGNNCGNFSVSGGELHTCAVVAGNGKQPPNNVDDDLIECWGSNFQGRSHPVAMGAFDEVSAGGRHTCARRLDGTVACWGDNSNGIISNTPTSSDFTQIASGFDHTCGLRTNSSVICWGLNNFGQASAPGGNFTQVAAGDVTTCGVRADATIACWGDDSENQVTGVPSGSNFVEVAVGSYHACGRRTDGTVDCWGANYSGEGADPAGTFTSITSGSIHNCGLRANSTVECWGDPDAFLGLLDAPGDAFSAIDAGAYYTCGLVSDGTILCWGFNEPLPPSRSEKCPTCGDGLLEGREECEACTEEFCDAFGACTPSPANPPFPERVCNTALAACCSPVTCTAYRLSENHVCRPGTGACDAPETCDGVNFSSCPAPGPLRPAGFVCRAPIGSCDPAETCTGTSNQCPASLPFSPAGTLCRALAGSCDIVENCTGTSAFCPNDVLVAASTTCRAVAGICDIVEVCSGSDAVCPDDAVKTSAVTCRAASGVCDVPEVCSGAATCPANSFAGESVTCRPSSAVCDAAEVCTGTGPSCPANAMAPNTTPCRPMAGGCDLVEFCTGTSTTCPANAFASSGTTCRASTGICDATETCPGGSSACPADAFSASTVTCRAAVDACDVAERCTGASNSCPANSFANAGTSCNDGAFCNGADTCNGSGACSTHAGNPCPGPDGDANCAESCNEASDNCSSLDPNGSPCADADACTNGETCTAGTCSGGTVTECDDGDVCTFDTCDLQNGCVHLPGIEETGCLTALKGQLFIRNSEFPWEEQLKWSWKKGQAVAPQLLGTPSIDTEYALCVFDRHGGGATLVGSYTIPGANLGWKEKPTRVVFTNKEAPPDGIYKLLTKSSTVAGKSGASLKAAGSSLHVFDPVGSQIYLYHEPSVVAQLRNSEGMCLTTEFFAPDFKKNWDNTVKAGYSR